jgi:phosphate transport system protein
MPRETLELKINELQDQLLMLGSLVEQAVYEAVTALQRRDIRQAENVYAHDRQINERRFQIERQAMVVIATQQPTASDLRRLAAIIEINTELERIGDYAKGICRIVALLDGKEVTIPITDLSAMAEHGLAMLHAAISAFVAGDIQAARKIPAEDQKVDHLYQHIYREMLHATGGSAESLDGLNYVLWAAHNLERLADRATNICERVVFMVSGEMQELDSPGGLF